MHALDWYCISRLAFEVSYTDSQNKEIASASRSHERKKKRKSFFFSMASFQYPYNFLNPSNHKQSTRHIGTTLYTVSSYKPAHYFTINVEAFDSLGPIARAPRSESTKTNSRWGGERENEFRNCGYHIIRLISRSHLKLQLEEEYEFGTREDRKSKEEVHTSSLCQTLDMKHRLLDTRLRYARKDLNILYIAIVGCHVRYRSYQCD